MMGLQRFCVGVLLAGWVLLARAACAFPDAATPPADWTQALRQLEISRCAGGREDPSPAVKAVLAKIDAAAKAPDYAPLIDATEFLIVFASGHQGPGKPEPDAWAALRKALDESAAGLRAARPAQGQLPVVWIDLSRNPGQAVQVAGTRLQLVPRLACAGGSPCPAFWEHLDMLRVVRLMDGMSGLLTGSGLDDKLKETILRDEQWTAYRADGKHQYWWELWANGKRMKPSDCPTAIEDGVQRRTGFCKVPQNQLVILHPDAALAWMHGAQGKSDLKGAFLVELLGYYRWHWASETSARMEGRRGVSVAAIYADRADGGRWGFGPLVHIGDVTFGATRARGTWSLTINSQLAGRYFDAKQKYLDKLKTGALGAAEAP